MNEGRLLILSPFEARHWRHTEELAKQRNRLVGKIAHSVLVIHAASQSKTELLCLGFLQHGKTVYALEGHGNINLLAAGALPVAVDSILSIPAKSGFRMGRGNGGDKDK